MKRIAPLFCAVAVALVLMVPSFATAQDTPADAVPQWFHEFQSTYNLTPVGQKDANSDGTPDIVTAQYLSPDGTHGAVAIEIPRVPLNDPTISDPDNRDVVVVIHGPVEGRRIAYREIVFVVNGEPRHEMLGDRAIAVRYQERNAVGVLLLVFVDPDNPDTVVDGPYVIAELD